MNIFFARFETTDFIQECTLELETLNSRNPMTLQLEDIRKELAKESIQRELLVVTR